MPGDPYQPSVPSWKKVVPENQRPRVAKHGWQQDQPQAGVPTSLVWRRVKQGLAAGGIVLTCVLLVVVYRWLVLPKPACLVVVTDSYFDNLTVPHNVWGLNAQADLRKLTESGASSSWLGSVAPQWRPVTDQSRAEDSLGMDLSKFKEKTAILFLALHGGADKAGPYLLVSKGQDLKRVYVKKLIEKLNSDELRDNNKVLILDATQLQAAPDVGILHNDFARQLEELNDLIVQVPNLVVISASDKGQHSLVSEEWQKTIFAHYVVEGLRGATKKSSERVTADSLFDYVKDRVERWARDNRGVGQTPVLLPKGDAGTKRAKRMELVVVSSIYEEAKPGDAPGASYKAPDKLVKAWQASQRLDQLVPHPAVYAPHLWRRYLDLLVRYEQLLRAGAENDAEQIKDYLTRLEGRLVEVRRLELGCAQNALPLPTALGLTADWLDRKETGEALSRRFDELWRTSDKDRKGLWDKTRDWARKEAEFGDKLVQVRFAGLALKKVEQQPSAQNFQHACDLLETLSADASPRPAEAHFLYMVREVLAHLQGSKPAELKVTDPLLPLLQKALAVRRLAEQTALATNGELAHPYSERVYRWIKDDVKIADEARRDGEDLLFSSNPDDLAKSDQRLGEAQKKYESAYGNALEVRRALAARDRVMTALPYYSVWLARQHKPAEGEGRTSEAMIRSNNVIVAELWKEVHRLALRLEDPDPRSITGKPAEGPYDKTPLSLKERTTKILADFTKIEEKFKEQCNQLSGRVVPSRWYEIEDALTVPFIEANLRESLVRNSRNISDTLNKESKRDTWPDAPQDQTQVRAQAQGVVALAVLGERRINDKQENGIDYQELLRWLFSRRDPSWEGPLNDVGDQVARHGRQMPGDIKQLTEDARGATLTEAEKKLREAERLCRQLNGAGTAWLDPFNPVDEGRRFHGHWLLTWQAQRTGLDFWASKNGTPFYREAGSRYVEDARKLLVMPDGLLPDLRADRQSAITTAREKLELRTLELASFPKHADLTTEEKLAVQFKVKLPAGVPPGRPVVAVTTGAGQETPPLLKLVNRGEADRIILERTGSDPELACLVASPYLEAERQNTSAQAQPRAGALAARAAFRGHRLECMTPVALHAVPDLSISVYPRPNASGIAVRADDRMHRQYGARNSHIVIVLDWSGSMKYPLRNGKMKRFEAAREALEKVLEHIEDETRVSVWAFSHVKVGATKAEDTIERLHEEILVWDKKSKQLSYLMDKVHGLVPDNETPLVRAMMEARKDFKNLGGFQSMIVLTDGIDNRFKGDASLKHNNRSISEYLVDEFKNSGIDIRFVGFELTDEEKGESKEQFRGAIEKLKGKYYDSVEGKDKLLANLHDAFTLQLRFRLFDHNGRLLDRNGKPVMDSLAKQDGLNISRTDGNLQWYKPLEPASYQARVHTKYRQDIDTKPGDLLLAELTGEDKFERVVFGREKRYSGKPRQQEGGWQLTVMQNLLTGARPPAAELLVALEDYVNLSAKQGDILRQKHPGFVWLEVKPEVKPHGVAQPLPVRWGNVFGYPAPMFRVEAANWPDGAVPVLAAWWIESPLPSAQVVLERRVIEGRPETLEEFKQRYQNVPVGDSYFTLEDVRYEKRRIEIAPGSVKKPERNCLVVRASYKGEPVLVNLRGPKVVENLEHQFYTQAGKYTGIFYSVHEDDVKGAFKLDLISIAAFKKDKNTLHVTLDKEAGMKAPSTDEQPPERPGLPPPD